MTSSTDFLTNLYHEKYTINHEESINAIRTSPDGTKFATASSSGIIRVYNIQDGSVETVLSGHTGGISDIQYSPINSNIIASCSDDLSVRLWSISKKKCIKILKKHTFHVTTIRFSTKGNILISGSADETITIWDLSSGKNLKTLAAHSDPILCICLTPDNSIIVSGSFDGLMRLFDTETGQCLKTLVFNSSSYGTATASTNDVVNPPISWVESSPNGKYILSSSLDGVIRLWDYMNNKVLKTYTGVNNDPVCRKYICGTKFITCTSEPLVVSGSDNGDLIFWNVQSKLIVYKYEQEKAPVFDIAVVENGRGLLTCNKEGVIRYLSIDESYVQ